MYKKKWGLVLATSVLAFSMAACGDDESEESTGSNGTTQIKFINGFTGGDGSYMTKIVDDFNESQDEFEVVQSQEPDHYTKFKSSQYDLVIMHESNLETYIQDQMIQPVSSFLEGAGLSEDEFHPAGLAASTVNDELYGFPLDIHPLTMFFNEEVVSEAPATYEDLVTLNNEAQSSDPNLYALGIPGSGLVEFYINMIAAQNDIDLEQDGYLNFAQEDFADALMIFHDMVFEDEISPAQLGLDGEFQTFMKNPEGGGKQAAIALTGPWYFQAAKEQYGDNLGIGSIPQIGDGTATAGNAHILAVPSNVQDGAVKEGVEAFLGFLYEPENLVNWAESGQTPTHLATLDLVSEDPETYELAAQNLEQLDDYVSMPHVYNYGEQMRYMNEIVFSKLVSEAGLTKEALMTELEMATEEARQFSGQ
ncbi:extracellular solute-binding protein [Jeotgalibacillus proteolyticus]|uniref:ABC transporter substrate-binding protein n=1 Tax=Jeotgalibacillus proteolyticus TaxID=2082395 RepID=A0A2S5G9E7_9BACL|nr:extracellular solute-binding protein [Jeotgalibacillus proteolyticus]PPA69620.1 hypothetical protein C4B60_13815 [Jeotgalibacillus proteolyticus]